MLTILNKFVFLIAIGVIAYLAYTALGNAPFVLISTDEAIPVVLPEMLNPVFIEPQAYGSPVGRDPFVIDEANNLDSSALILAQQAAARDDDADSVGKLMGIVIGDDGRRLALIDSQIHSVGSLVELPDSDELWQIYSIDDKSVVLTSNGQQTVLEIPSIDTDYENSDDVEADVIEVEKYKEYVQ